MDKKVNTSSLVKWAVVSIIPIVISGIALYQSYQAIRIADKSFLITHQINLPSINVICQNDLNFDTMESTVKVTVTNGGGPLRKYNSSLWTIIELTHDPDFEPLQLLLWDYFDKHEYTGNTQGLLQTSFGENNYGRYLSLSEDFRIAAEEDGYWARITSEPILIIDYVDYVGNNWSKAFQILEFHYSPGYEIDHDYALYDRIIPAVDNANLAASEGLGNTIASVNGTRLWNWYKKQVFVK